MSAARLASSALSFLSSSFACNTFNASAESSELSELSELSESESESLLDSLLESEQLLDAEAVFFFNDIFV
jgi:hypothetical protein